MELIQHSKPWITDSDVRAVADTVSGGMIAKGLRVQSFEDAVAAYNGTPGCVAVGSATAAISLALRSMGIGEGDEVILPTYVCISVANAVKSVGATPVLCDVGDHWNMTPRSVEPHISKATKAIILVHIFGIPSDASSFTHFKIPIIEDCCQAFGATVRGRKVGTIGSVGVFSFNAIKCLTTGEGGMATSTDQALIDRMKRSRSDNIVASPMTDIQASLGLSQIARYGEMLLRRKKISEAYFAALPERLTEKLSGSGGENIYFRFPITIGRDFDSLRVYFESKAIAVRRGVDSLIHRQWGLPDKAFPEAVELFNTTLSLPIYPALTAEEAAHTIKEVIAAKLY